jgi:hypothetical protein
VSTPAFRKGSLAPPLAEERVQPRLDSSWQGKQLGVRGRPPLIQHEPRDIRGQRRPPKAPGRIDHYEFGQIVVDARQETNDLIILPDRVVRNWWRRDGHALVLDDPVEVLDELPPHLVVGTGAHGRMRPDPPTLQQLWERGVTVETLPTGQVVRRFAALDPAGTTAALHLTC